MVTDDRENRGDSLRSFDDLASLYNESFRKLEVGDLIEGKVIAVKDDYVVIDIGYKSEGRVPKNEFIDFEGNVTVKVGDVVPVVLQRLEDVDGNVVLSHLKAVIKKRWELLERSFKEKETVKGRVVDKVKEAGLYLDLGGITAFLPASQIDVKPVKGMSDFKGEIMEVKILSLDRKRNNVVVSRKAVIEEQLERKKLELKKRLVPGNILKGTVKNITDFGVFVDLGGIDGLLHLSDISWGRIEHPSELFRVGDEIEVMVLKYDKKSGKVSLGYKQKKPDPWSFVEDKYKVGDVITGRVINIVEYGIFVELEEGVEGLVHLTELSWQKNIKPQDVAKVGDTIQAKIVGIDFEKRRINLSLRALEPNPWDQIAQKFPVGTVVEGRVTRLVDFGAFVEIDYGIEGLVHVSDMSWGKRISHPKSVLSVGETIKARITNVDPINKKISLSIKEFIEDDWEPFVSKFQIGDTVIGKITRVVSFGLFLDIFKGIEGLAHISEIDFPGGKLEAHFKPGQWIKARILKIDDINRKVSLTVRGLPRPNEKEIEEYLKDIGAKSN